MAVNLSVSPASLTAATVGVSYTTTITASGGSGSYTFAVNSGSLPAGLSLSSGGILSGTPTAGGSFSFTIQATDTNNVTGSQTYTLTVNAATITITGTLPAATANSTYSQSLGAVGGTAPYVFTYSGSLPAGLTLSSAGVLSGTPTAAGNSTFTVQATDSSTGTGAPYQGTQSYTVTVNLGLTQSLPAPMVAAVYSQTITASGGSGSCTFALSSGSLPAGLTLSSGGVLSGTPTAGGPFSFGITATDASQHTGTQAYAFTVSVPTIAISPSTLSAGTYNTSYSQNLSATGGTAPYSFSRVSGTLPTGLTLSSAGVLSGTLTAAGSFTFTVQATDHSTGTCPTTPRRVTR